MIPREDLLALTPDDLIALSNRGIVKRAQREAESGEAACEITEDSAGEVRGRWPDGAACRLSPREPLSQDCCTCPATTVCRHLIGTILAYQRQASTPTGDSPKEAASWDPGAIPNEVIAACWTARQLTSAQQQFDQGLVIELHRGPRPRARLHSVAHSLRFLVPGDIRYTRCDCADPAPCIHVLLAIWAFRRLPPERTSGLISTAAEPPIIPTELLADLDHTLEELLDHGIAQLPDPFVRRLERLEDQCRKSDLVWLAEILSEILQSRQQYCTHDARFSPSQLATLIGELVIRADAARSPQPVVPPVFIRGSSSEGTSEMGHSRLIGLGTSVETRRSSVVLVAYLQDAATGVVVALPREFANPKAGDPVRPFADLARTVVFKDVSVASVAEGQILVHGGKRTPNGEFRPGRTRAALNPQSYQWENLRAPVLAAGFADLLRDQALQPHPCLRPRRLAGDLHVCAISAVEHAQFNVRDQSVEATLIDAEGESAKLVHPYSSRGRSGAEALLYHLQNSKLLFVAGRVTLASTGLVISPTGLVFKRGEDRWMLQPWLAAEAIAQAPRIPDNAGVALPDPLRRNLAELLDLLGEAALLGRARVTSRWWQDLHSQSQALGLLHIPAHIEPASALTLSALVTYTSMAPDHFGMLVESRELKGACDTVIADQKPRSAP